MNREHKIIRLKDSRCIKKLQQYFIGGFYEESKGTKIKILNIKEDTIPNMYIIELDDGSYNSIRTERKFSYDVNDYIDQYTGICYIWEVAKQYTPKKLLVNCATLYPNKNKIRNDKLKCLKED